MISNPTLNHKSMRTLLKDLRGRSNLTGLAAIPTVMLEFAIAVPVALAVWIDQFKPELKDRNHLHIVIAGEPCADLINMGRWFQLLPILLDRINIEIKITLVGSNITGDSIFDLNGSLLEQLEPATIFNGSLGQFADKNGLKDVDLVFLSHLGLEFTADTWCTLQELGKVLDCRVPVGLASYDHLEYEQERWMLNQYGYTDTNKAVSNHLTLTSDTSSLSARGRTLWELGSAVPMATYSPDPAKLAQALRYEEWANSMYEAKASAFIHKTKPQVDSEGFTFVEILPGYFVELSSAIILEGPDGLSGIDRGTLSIELLSKYPDESSLPFEIELWVMEAAQELMTKMAAQAIACVSAGTTSVGG